MKQRCFPPPWSVDESDACFIVCDANGQALAYVYFEETRTRCDSSLPITQQWGKA